MKIVGKSWIIFLVLGTIIGVLFCFAFLIKTEPTEVKTLEWRDKYVYDTTEFHHNHYITAEGDTAPIDTTTRLMDMPILTFKEEFRPPISINEQIVNPPIIVEAEVRGILYSLAVETEEGWQTSLGEQKCKFDWKWSLITFTGGIILGMVLSEN